MSELLTLILLAPPFPPKKESRCRPQWILWYGRGGSAERAIQDKSESYPKRRVSCEEIQSVESACLFWFAPDSGTRFGPTLEITHGGSPTDLSLVLGSGSFFEVSVPSSGEERARTWRHGSLGVPALGSFIHYLTKRILLKI